jgi:oligopeptide transport system substrate-binding protein
MRNHSTMHVYNKPAMRWTASLLIILPLVLVAGCGKGNFSERTNAERGNVFRYPITAKPTTLDPAIVKDGDTIDLLQQTFEGLTTWGTDNRVVGDIAERWDVSDDGTVYTFHLKKGVKFHSGREVTADDFKYSWERAAEPGLKSTTVDAYLGDVVGVKDMLAKKATSLSGVRVIDPYTLEVRIDKARPYFLGKLNYIVSAVVDKDFAKKGKEITTVAEMIGTGPFKASEYAEEQKFTQVAFADYHGGAPKLEKIERPVISDPQQRLNRYRSGELDQIRLERQDVKAIQEDPKMKDHLKFFDRPSTYYVGFNQLKYPPFKDVRVRRAFAMAINRTRIVKDILGGINQEANSIVPPGVDGYRPDAKGLPYDPAAAKKLLAEAGYADGSKLPPLDFFCRSEQRDVTIVAEAIQGDLEKNLGVKVNLKPTAWQAYLDLNDANELPMFHMRWAADYLDPQNFLSNMLAWGAPENHVGYHSPKFDELCAKADVELDRDKRMRMYAEAEDLALQEAPWAPVYFQKDAELINPRVQGLRESLFGHLPHTTVTLGSQ